MTSIEAVTATFSATALIPAVSINLTSPNIILPDDNAGSFVISNTGVEGSIMDYFVVDTSGYLNISNMSGSVPGGQSTQVNVAVLPKLATVTNPYAVLGSLIGTTKGVAVLTPQASNYIQIPVSFNILEQFTVNVEVAGSVDAVENGVTVNVETNWGTTTSPATCLQCTRAIVVPGASDAMFTVVIASGQPASTHCSVDSGGSGTFGPDMPTVVIDCE